MRAGRFIEATGLGPVIRVLGGRNGITLPGLLLVAPLAVGVQLIAAAHDGDPVGPVLVSGCIAQLAIAVLLWLARTGLDRARPVMLLRAAVTVASFGASGVIRTVAYLVAGGDVAQLPPGGVAAALGAGVAVAVVGLTLGAVVVDLADRFIGRSRQLRRERARLDNLRTGAAQDLAAVNRLVEEVVAAPLRVTLAEVEMALADPSRRVDAATASQSLRLAELAHDLRRAADSIVRPLSHDIAERQDLSIAEAVSPPIPMAARLRDFASATLTVAPFQPLATLYVAVSLCLLATLPHLDAPGVLVGVSLGAASGLAAVIVPKRWVAPRLPSAGAPARALVVGGVWVGQAALWLVTLWPLLRDLPSWPNLLAALVAMPLFSLIVAGGAASADGRRHIEVQLDDTLAAVAAETGLLRREAAQKRSVLARLLHGPVLGSLTAAALLVAAAATSDEPAASDEARAAIAHATAAIAALASPLPDGHDLAGLLDEHQRLWAGLLTVEVRGDPAARDTAYGTALLAAIDQIIGECLSNAVRHGHASRVTIAIDQAPKSAGGQDALVIGVDDDGTPAGAAASRGLGSALFDDLANAWQREPLSGGGTRVRLELAR